MSSVHSSSEPVHQWMSVGLGQRGDLGDEVQDALVGGGRLGAVMAGCLSGMAAVMELSGRRGVARACGGSPGTFARRDGCGEASASRGAPIGSIHVHIGSIQALNGPKWPTAPALR